MTAFEAILLTIVTASTPLLIAAIGELVAERSGVLNLGVEGMMAMGAACSFAAAVTFDSTSSASLAGILAGALMAALFARRGARLCREPGRLGPGADDFRPRPVGPDRRALRRLAPRPDRRSWRSRSSATSRSSARLFFAQDVFVYALDRADDRGRLVPHPHPAGPGPALRRREPRLGPRPRPAGAAHCASWRSCSAAPARASRAPTCPSSTPASGRPA